MSTSSAVDKTEWEGIVMEAIATMIYVFICCGVVASTSNVTFDELNSPRLVVIALARKKNTLCGIRSSIQSTTFDLAQWTETLN